VDELVGLGHRPADIATYTLRQIRSYIELGSHREKAAHQVMVSLMRSAYHADKDQFKKLMSSFGD
jgi:hypothetical protein